MQQCESVLMMSTFFSLLLLVVLQLVLLSPSTKCVVERAQVKLLPKAQASVYFWHKYRYTGHKKKNSDKTALGHF